MVEAEGSIRVHLKFHQISHQSLSCADFTAPNLPPIPPPPTPSPNSSSDSLEACWPARYFVPLWFGCSGIPWLDGEATQVAFSSQCIMLRHTGSCNADTSCHWGWHPTVCVSPLWGCCFSSTVKCVMEKHRGPCWCLAFHFPSAHWAQHLAPRPPPRQPFPPRCLPDGEFSIFTTQISCANWNT